MLIRIRRQDWNGSTIAVNGKVMRLTPDLDIEVPIEFIEVLGNARIPYTRVTSGTKTGRVIIPTTANTRVRVAINGVSYTYPVGSPLVIPANIQEVLATAGVPLNDEIAEGSPPPPVSTNSVPPTIAGTLTNGSTITCTPGVWTGGTISRQWMRDGVAIAGQTGLTYTYNASNDDGSYLSVSETDGTFTAASNALIGFKALPAPVTWNPSDKSANITLSNGNLTAQNTVASNRLVRATVAASGKVYFEYTPAVAAGSVIGIAPPSQSTSDWVGSANTGGGGYSNSAGVFANGGGSQGYGATWTNGDVIAVAIDVTARKAWFAKNNVWQSGNPETGTGGLTITGAETIFAAWSASNTTANGSINFGGTSFAYAPPAGFSAYDPNLQPIGITSTSVSSSASPTGQPRITANGKTNGVPTQLQVAVLSASGAILLPWQDVAGLSASNFTVSTGDLPSSAQGTTVRLLVRDKVIRDTATSSNVAISFYATIFPTTVGLNEGYWAQWNPVDPTNDIVERGRWVRSSYANLPTANLDPATLRPTSYPSGDTSVILVVGGAFYTPGDVYVLTYPPGMTVTTAVIANATVTQAFSGGTGEVTMGTGEVSLNLRFSGTIPVGGIVATFKKKGLASTKRYTAKLANDYTEAGFKIARYLTPIGANTLPTFTPTSGAQITGEYGCTPAFMCEFANDTGTDVYFNVHHLADDSYVSAVAAYFAANLNSSRKLYIELSNEMWNTIFPVHDYSRMTGSALGFYNSAGNAAPSTIVAEQLADPLAGTTSQAYTSGTRIFANLYGTGWQVWQAVGNQAAGSIVEASSNANWTVIATNAQTATAGRRWQAQRSKEVFALFDAAFGASARTRTIRVLGVQAADTNLSVIAERLLWGNLYQSLDRIAIAPYWGDRFGSYASGVDHDSPGFTLTEKALYATNVNAWKDALFAAGYTDIDTVVGRAATMKQGLESLLRQAPYNLPADTIRLMSYEINHHLVMNSYPNRALALAAFNSFIADPRLATITSYYLSRLKALVGGEHLMFDSVCAPVVTGAPNVQGWGIMYKQGDRTQPQYNAIKSWIASNT